MTAPEYQPDTTVLVALGLIGLVLIGSMFYVLVFPTRPTIVHANYTITIPANVSVDSSLNFDPFNLTIKVGQSVQWVNKDSVPHSSTALSVPTGATKWDSGELDGGDTFTVTFTVVGTYQYHCIFHPLWMRGTIVVTS
jgi:plastocyanin